MSLKGKRSEPASPSWRAAAGTFAYIKSEMLSESLRLSENLQASLAEHLTTLVLESYWTEVQDRSGSKLPFPKPVVDSEIKLDRRKEPQLEDLGRALATLPVDYAAYEAGQLYSAFLPRKMRSERGIFYTPPMLARRLIQQADKAGVDWTRAKVIDPACGGGAFLVPVAIKVIETLKGASPAIVARNLRERLEGWEISEFSSWLTKFFIEVAAADISAATKSLINPNVRTLDSLACSSGEFARFDLVIGNPPFGRVKLDELTRKRFDRSLFGHANLYGVFTDLAVHLARPGAVVAYLTPASFLAGEYFKKLRALLSENAPPVSIDFVSSRRGVFDGVLQETVLATYKKSSKRRTASVSAIELKSDQLKIDRGGRFALPESPTAPWLIPRNGDDKSVAAFARLLSARLQHWGYAVSTGPLVWNRHKSQLSQNRSESCFPIVWAESVSQDGKFEFRSEKRNHSPFIQLNSPRDDWLKVRRASVLLQRTTAKEQKRRLIAAEMPDNFLEKHGCVTVENHLNMIYPTSESPAVTTKVVAAFLNSEAADRVFRCLSGSVAVSAYELNSLPLPDPSQLQTLKDLVASDAPREEIERECWSLYGED